MSKPRRIYLDNAATSWPKPEAAYRQVERYQRELGAPAGRGVYREAGEVERLVVEARSRIAQLIGAESPERVVFTFNGTDSLNLALHGLLQPGDHVVTSVVEHNSVLRPLRYLESGGRISVTRVLCDGRGVIDPDSVRAAIRPNTKLIALLHASNVTGAVQPVEQVGSIAREHDVLLLVDAAQSLGHWPVRVQQLGADLLAAPGHKGLLGPLGTGILYVAPGVEDRLRPVRQGGTGSNSEEDRQPDWMPDKYETGNHNVLGLIGLGAAVAFLQEKGLDHVRQHHEQLTSDLLCGLGQIDGLAVHGPGDPKAQVGVVSVTLRGYGPQEVASLLDSTYSIQVRAGFHCASLVHRYLGTADKGGTVRFSPGVFTTKDEIETTIRALAEIAASAMAV